MSVYVDIHLEKENIKSFFARGEEFSERSAENIDALKNIIATPYLYNCYSDLKFILSFHGFVIVKFNSPDLNDTLYYVMYLLSMLGQPIKIVQSEIGLWREINVDIGRQKNRSRGTGDLPLHMDFVNTENPPDLVCLFCVRDDPLGGGQTLIAPFSDIECELPESNLNLLKMRMYEDGEVVGLSNVGKDINPFAIFSESEKWKFRYSGHLIDSSMAPNAKLALIDLDTKLKQRVQKYTLKQNELLIMDQHKVVHGRQALGYGQSHLKQQLRRLVLQSYVRYI